MRIILILIAIGHIFAKTPATDWAQMSQAQRDSIKVSFDWGAQYGLGFTYAIFDWDESSGGLHLINLAEYSGGRYGQKVYYVFKHRIKEVAVRDTTEPTIWQLSRIMEELILNRETDRLEAKRHIEILQGRYGKNRWMKIWSRWNGGNGEYAKTCRARMIFLYNLGWRNKGRK